MNDEERAKRMADFQKELDHMGIGKPPRHDDDELSFEHALGVLLQRVMRYTAAHTGEERAKLANLVILTADYIVTNYSLQAHLPDGGGKAMAKVIDKQIEDRIKRFGSLEGAAKAVHKVARLAYDFSQENKNEQ